MSDPDYDEPGGRPILTEEVTTEDGTYTQQWYCQPPPAGTPYRVTDCTWGDHHTIRRIYAITLGQGHDQR